MSIKKTKRVLGAKVKVTKSDAKKLKPLANYWHDRMSRDNWFIFSFGVLFGILLGLIV